MQYMITIRGTDEGWATAGEKLWNAHAEVIKEIRRTGELVETHELDATDAKVLRKDHFGLSVTDGPYMEGKELAGGYYLVDVTGPDRALEIATKLMEGEPGPIEVRAIVTR